MAIEQGRPSTLSVETPEAVAFSYELAGIGSRGMAIVIDTVLLALIVLVEGGVTALAATFLEAAGASVATPWVLGAFVAAAFVTYWGYFLFGEVARGGRTPGKRRVGIRVVRDDGGPVGFTDSVIRNVLRIVDMLPGYYAVGIVAALLSKSGKRLGDMVAGTVVVRDAEDLSLPDPSTLLRPEDALVAEFLARRPQLAPEARWQVAVELLSLYGETPQPGWDEPVTAGRLADLAGLRGRIDAAGASG
jgi:uncharacterized RDD family membrane protein YckC